MDLKIKNPDTRRNSKSNPVAKTNGTTVGEGNNADAYRKHVDQMKEQLLEEIQSLKEKVNA